MARGERFRVTIEAELPQGTALEDLAGLVLHQMRAPPKWDEPAGTGNLNHVCCDGTMRVVSAEIING